MTCKLLCQDTQFTLHEQAPTVMPESINFLLVAPCTECTVEDEYREAHAYTCDASGQQGRAELVPKVQCPLTRPWQPS